MKAIESNLDRLNSRETSNPQLFNALAEKGTVRMPFHETFWANRFAMLVDRFGTP
jgi:uncharacterized glyoxalase superfamily protein PhnB